MDIFKRLIFPANIGIHSIIWLYGETFFLVVHIIYTLRVMNLCILVVVTEFSSPEEGN